MNGRLDRETYIGHDAQHMRGVLALRHPIKNGIIRNWDDMEKARMDSFFFPFSSSLLALFCHRASHQPGLRVHRFGSTPSGCCACRPTSTRWCWPRRPWTRWRTANGWWRSCLSLSTCPSPTWPCRRCWRSTQQGGPPVSWGSRNCGIIELDHRWFLFQIHSFVFSLSLTLTVQVWCLTLGTESATACQSMKDTRWLTPCSASPWLGETSPCILRR